MPSYSSLAADSVFRADRNAVDKMVTSVFDFQNQMVRCSPATGKYMACSLLFRGDVTPSEVVTSMPSVRNMRTVNFVDWCPT